MKALRLLALSAACISGAYATQVIDQNQALYSGGFAYINSSYDSYQSFQQTADNISGAGIQLGAQWGSGTANFTVAVFSANPYTTPGSLLASGTAVGSPGAWVDAFWAPIDVSAYSTLYVAISTSTGGFFANAFGYPNPYGLGTAGFLNNPAYANGIYDLTFRTYSDSDYQTPGVPDGGLGVAMLGAAFAGLVALRRKAVRA